MSAVGLHLLLLLVGPPDADGRAVPLTDRAAVRSIETQIGGAIAAGRLDEAASRLDGTSLPAAVHHRLAGRIAWARGDADAADGAWTKALELTPQDTTLRLHLAQVRLAAGRPGAALEALEGTESLAAEAVAQPLLRARALRGVGRADEAYGTLVAATRAFPREPGPPLELVALCVDRELYTAAQAWARGVADGADRPTTVALMGALLPSRGSRPFLEQLAARFPDDPDVRARLAAAYALGGRWHVAGDLYAEATALGGDYAHLAADQFRLAGDTRRALESNAAVRDPARRLRQRLHILFAAEDFARVIAMEPRVLRSGLATPADRYRFAYAQFLMGHHARATTLAKDLLDTDQAGRARTLLRAMGRDGGAQRNNEATTKPR